MDRAYTILDIKSTDDGERIIEGIASTPTADRMGDIVEPLGAEFTLPMPLLWQHNHDQPVGHVEFAKPTKNGIPFKARLAKVDEPGALKDLLDLAWQSVKALLVRAVSIGFRPLEYAFLDNGGVHFTKWEWLELSLVTIPAQAEATIDRIKSIDRATRGAPAGEGESTVARPGVAGKRKAVAMGAPSRSKTPSEGGNVKTIAEQIAGFAATKAAKVARMKELMDLAGEGGTTLEAAESEEYDTLEAEVAEVDKHLARLEKLEKASASTVAPVNGGDAGRGTVTRGIQLPATPGVVIVEPKLEKGIGFARFVKCMAAAKGDMTLAQHLAKTHYPNYVPLHNAIKAAWHAGGSLHILERAAQAAATTLDADFAAPLVDYQNLAAEFIEYLRPQTIIGKFGVGNVPALRRVPFNISVPRMTGGSSGYWVGEGNAKPLTGYALDNVTLRWAKVAAICVLTEELIRFSSPNAETLTRDELARGVIARIDTDFVDPDKAATANVSPASITNGVAGAESAGTTAANIQTDIKAAFAPFIAAGNAPSQGVWIMNSMTALTLSLMKNDLGQPEYPGLSMTGGTFAGLPVIVSDYVTSTYDADGAGAAAAGSILILVNASDILLADDGDVTVDASREASLQMDTAPTMDSDTPTATSVVSMFQTNSVAIRAERYINWAKRRASAVSLITGVDYDA